MSDNLKYKIVYCTPALYMAGGVERVLTLKANYFAENYDYEITIILTEGADKPLFYSLSDKIKVINLNIGFEELWTCSFVKKIFVYLIKQIKYKKLLTEELLRIRPDITVSLLRREINFITGIKDGSKKIGELHLNRANYRNFDKSESNWLKNIFSKLWMKSLLNKLKQLECLVVLTENDKDSWKEIDNVVAIPNPLSFNSSVVSPLLSKRVITVGRYCHQKGYDLLLRAWSEVQHVCPDWRLDIFGDGDKKPYKALMKKLQINISCCELHGRTSKIQKEYINSSLAVCSSRFEGFGLVIIEAMACGLPVISFDCPWGPSSIIKDGEDGILVENGNVEELTKAIIKLIKENETRSYMAQNASQNIKRYEIENIAPKWRQLFESL